jgi:hypothetical protein
VAVGRGTVASVTYLMLFVFIGLGAVLALVAAVAALGAYLRFQRTRLELQDRLALEVESLSRRTGELERSLVALQERSARLPISISGLQQNLSTLQVLTGALAGSLRQAQGVHSYNALKTLSGTHLGRLLRVPSVHPPEGAENGSSRPRGARSSRSGARPAARRCTGCTASSCAPTAGSSATAPTPRRRIGTPEPARTSRGPRR